MKINIPDNVVKAMINDVLKSLRDNCVSRDDISDGYHTFGEL